MTNSERIRNLSDEELAVQLIFFHNGYEYYECPDGECFGDSDMAIEHTVEWLGMESD